jgi:hypothetical protein
VRRFLRPHTQSASSDDGAHLGRRAPKATATKGYDLLLRGLDPDDERAELAEEEVQNLFDEAVEGATLASSGDAAKTDNSKERQLLDEMQGVADQARGLPDAKVRRLIEWIRKHLCAGARLPDDGGPQAGAKWTDLRLLVFTEYDDTKRYLVNQLRAAVAGTDLDESRIEIFHGPTPSDRCAVLITSANFTQAAQSKNIEAGILMRDADAAQRLDDYFSGLIRSHELLPFLLPIHPRNSDLDAAWTH